jgi:hypothetical protein
MGVSRAPPGGGGCALTWGEGVLDQVSRGQMLQPEARAAS